MNSGSGTVNTPMATSLAAADRPRLRVRRVGDEDRPAEPMPTALIQATGIEKSYSRGSNVVPVLRGVDFTAAEGQITTIIGQSGSGKSTLMHLLGSLDRPDAGAIYYRQRRIDNLSRRQRDDYRNREIGFIFQFYHLLPELTTLENVLMPQMIGMSPWMFLRHRKSLRRRSCELLAAVGLEHRLQHRPCELSGGEMQRTAIARALVARPQLLLADEPTGNLDPETGRGVIAILRSLQQQHGLTVIMVTHDERIAAGSDAVVRLVDGVVSA